LRDTFEPDRGVAFRCKFGQVRDLVVGSDLHPLGQIAFPLGHVLEAFDHDGKRSGDRVPNENAKDGEQSSQHQGDHGRRPVSVGGLSRARSHGLLASLVQPRHQPVNDVGDRTVFAFDHLIGGAEV
jgi:hypothetical protein